MFSNILYQYYEMYKIEEVTAIKFAQKKLAKKKLEA